MIVAAPAPSLNGVVYLLGFFSPSTLELPSSLLRCISRGLFHFCEEHDHRYFDSDKGNHQGHCNAVFGKREIQAFIMLVLLYFGATSSANPCHLRTKKQFKKCYLFFYGLVASRRKIEQHFKSTFFIAAVSVMIN